MPACDQTKIVKLNFERYIAYRILQKDRKNFSRPVVSISVIAVALGIAIMLIAVSVVTGFQETVTDKITGFTSHIRVMSYDNNRSWEIRPVSKDQSFVQELKADEGVRHIQVYGLKAGIMKHDDQILGTILKGVGEDHRREFMSENIKKGYMPEYSDSITSKEIVISDYHARKLRLDTGMKVLMYFIQDPPRYRPFTIAGIYNTGMEEMDQRFVICDIRQIQKLNDWDEDQVAGFEIFLNDFDDLEEYTAMVYENTSFDLKVENIRTLHPQIMDWLNMLNTNVYIILVLMLIVSAITMVSTLLILILEKTIMIGIMKAMGSKNKSIRKIFLYNAVYIIGKGILWGNIFGIGILLVQKLTGAVSLDESTYYMATVPVNINLIYILLINIVTIFICILFMIFPSYLITRITPINAIRFE